MRGAQRWWWERVRCSHPLPALAGASGLHAGVVGVGVGLGGCVCVWHECVVILYTVARWCMRAIRPNRRARPSSVLYPPCRRIGSARLKWSQFSATYRAYPLHETCCMACRSRLHAAVAGGKRMTLKWRSGRGHVSWSCHEWACCSPCVRMLAQGASAVEHRREGDRIGRGMGSDAWSSGKTGHVAPCRFALCVPSTA